MTLLDAVLSRRHDVAERAITPSQAAWMRGDDIAGVDSLTGVRVSRETALGVSAVWACVSLISDSIATLPVDAVTYQDNVPKPYQPRPVWMDVPNPEQTRVDFVFGTVASLLLDGNAFIYLVRDRKQDVIEAWLLDPRWVQVRREFQPDGSLALVYYVMVAKGQQSPVGPFRVVAGPDMFHIMAFQPNSSWPRGVGPLEQHALFGAAIAGQEMGARFFGHGMNAAGVIEAPDMTLEQAKQLKQDFTNANAGIRKMHLPPVLTGGATWKQIQISPEQAQFIEQRQFSVDEIARFFRVPPHMIGNLEKTTSWGTGIEQQSIGFVRYTLRPWIERIEEAWTRHMLIFQDGAKVRFDVDGLMRGDAAAQAAYAQARFQTASMSPNEIRAMFGEAPVDNGDTPYFPVNMAPVGTEPIKIAKVEAEDPHPDESLAGDAVAGVPAPRSITAPAITVEIPPFPEIPAPIVNVTVPEQPPAEVRVNVEPPQVRLELPKRRKQRRTIDMGDGRKAIVTDEEVEA